ncbi:alkaline phosphatase D [Roseimicrobium gellanilyticum]|uniref:Alkaline phosphatase D n=1 Tax=Roseimicrobium gellanilyticum TaxID=748857 RepID=A0A366HQZ5_9BACT|nr:alkaline phosphatase D family protein [Roseimicrobium gellanilyticum]RBP46085.1 alkaline phosphatase D [Roseimicrobium gellanilyticum]
MTRREFIAATSALPAATLAAEPGAPVPKDKNHAKPKPASAPKPPHPQIPPLTPIPGPACLEAGPMLGHVSDEEAWIWVKASKPSTLKVRVSEHADLSESREVAFGPVDERSGRTASVRVDNLHADKRYYYEVLLDDRIVSSMPAPSFVAASPSVWHGRIRVAFGSCVGRLPEYSAATWGDLAARGNFDLFLMLGDNHYGDTTELERQRLYYTAHRQLAGFREITAQRPVYAIWDDHDFGPNNSDSTSVGKEQSRQAFHEYWANPVRITEKEDPAIYHTFERSGVGFFMLDVRWHRTPNKDPDGAAKTMLGATQLAWLKRELKASKARVKIIASGSEWQTYSQPDSWAKFLTERDALLSWMQQEGIEGVIFVSGDRHFSAGYHIHDRWVEFTSGPLGSDNPKNPTSLVSPETFTFHHEGKLWTVLDIDCSTAIPAVSYEVWQAGEGMIESTPLAWEAICGRELIAKSERVMEVREEQERKKAGRS